MLGHRPPDHSCPQPVSPTVDREAVVNPACSLRDFGELPVSCGVNSGREREINPPHVTVTVTVTCSEWSPDPAE